MRPAATFVKEMTPSMINSVSTDILIDWPPEDAIRIIGEAGFPCVEFGFKHEERYLEGREDEGERIQAIRRAAEKAGVQILQMHGRLFNPCAGNVDEDIAWAHRSIRRAAQLGVRWVVLHPGSAAGMGSDPEVNEWCRSRNVELFRSFVRTAVEVGTGVAVENMIGGRRGPRFGVTVSDLLWLLAQVNSPALGVCWDTGHANLSRVEQGKALRAIRTRLVALHINDNDGEEDRHWAPFRGTIAWDDVMQALRDIGYSGPFNMELPGEQKATPQALRADKLRYLSRVGELMIGMQEDAWVKVAQ